MKTFVLLLVLSLSLHTMATSTEDLSFDAPIEQSLQNNHTATLPFNVDKININIKKKFSLNDYSSMFWRGNKRLVNAISTSEYHVNTLGNIELFFINEDVYSDTNHIEYRLGNFSVETGFTSVNMDDGQGKKIFSKGSLIIFSNNSFGLNVSAQVEILDETLTYDFYQPLSPESYNIGTSTVSSLSITGSYKVNSKWQVVGAVSTTHVSEELTNSPLIKEVNRNIAVIGTTYSF